MRLARDDNHNVMRGEETQLLGARIILLLLSTSCLHALHVSQMQSISTISAPAMTGEMPFAALIIRCWGPVCRGRFRRRRRLLLALIVDRFS